MKPSGGVTASLPTSGGAGGAESCLSRRRPLPAPGQLEQVVARADQRPLGLDFREAAQEELAEAARPFDEAEDRFDDALAPGVERAAALGLQLPAHPVAGREGLGDPAARRRGAGGAALTS